MRKALLPCLFFVLILAPSVFGQGQMEDVLYLKDGSVIRGTIIEQIPNVSIKIQTRDRSEFVYKMEEVSRITREQAVGMAAYGTTEKKSPVLAFCLSFVVPGLGQYYNGDIAKGVIQDVMYVGGWVLFYTEDTETNWSWVGLGMVLGSEVWSMIDAPISASRINKRAAQSYGHLLEWDQGGNIVGLDVGPTPDGIGAEVSYHF